MTAKTKSLTFHIWSYLALFTMLILALLWIFQVLFFDFYYEARTTSNLEKIAQKTKEFYEKNTSSSEYDMLAYDNNACIEIVENGVTTYTSNFIRRGCIFDNEQKNKKEPLMDEENTNFKIENDKILKENLEFSYKNDFINSNENSKLYIIVNPAINNKTLVSSTKLSDNTYAFINVSLEPTDPAISIIREELIYITIILSVLSFVFAYFISKRVSHPILKINERAKKMAEGDLVTPFNAEENIKEIRELNDTLNVTKEELSKIDETRKDLLANVSHDLKTPLTMIKAYAELSRDLHKDNEEKRNENLNIIIEESERLNLLVNDILDLSKQEKDMEVLSREDFELTSFIETIIHRFDYLKEEGYTFIFNKEKDYIINADKKKLEQVIYNLLINATNYTGEDKKVTVEIKEEKKYLRIYIIDTGKGISKEEIDKIWDKYYKNEKNHKRNKIGTGLGLSIVKNILIKHGFNYGVESKIGKGTKFYFDINKK